jgi:hypothetical protein
MISNVFTHAADMARLLATEWEVPGQVRAWHATIFETPHGMPCHYSLVQRRGVEGFQVGMVSFLRTESMNSNVAFTLPAACIWLGLSLIHAPLDWHYEL